MRSTLKHAHLETEPSPTWKECPLNRDSLEQLTDEWSDLVKNCTEPNVFLQPWFLRHSLPLFVDQTVSLFCAYKEGLLIGLFPVQRTNGYAKLPLHFLKPALHAHQFLATPLVRQGYERHFASAICDWLDKIPTKHCFILLTHISIDGPISKALNLVCEESGRRCDLVMAYERACIDFRQLKYHTKAPKTGKSTRRKLKLLKDQYAVKVEHLHNPSELASWLNDFFRLEDLGWKGQLRTSILSNTDEQAFYEKMLTDAMHENALVFNRLSADDRPIAYTLDLIAGEEAFCLKSAYDPDFSKYSPGVLLEHETQAYYEKRPEIIKVDSCASADHPVLNKMWGQRKEIAQFLVARRGTWPYLQFTLARTLEKLAQGMRRFIQTRLGRKST